MNRKILIGSILVVALLLLVSFSNVVGYSSVKSDIKIYSPLFSIRNNKGDVSTDYLGKEVSINLLLPKRNDKAELIDKFIEILKVMDDSSFDKFVKKLIPYINQQIVNNIKFKDKEIEDALYHIKDNPEILKNIDKDISKSKNSYYDTCRFFCGYETYENIFCTIWMIIALIILGLAAIAIPFMIYFWLITLLIDSLCKNDIFPTTNNN